MAYDSRAIANWFIDRALSDGDRLTQMKLQKLVYIAHGWHLGLQSDSLIHDPVEAWKWGPVIRALYREFREFGADPISRKAQVLDGGSLEDREISINDYPNTPRRYSDTQLLERIWTQYGEKSAAELMELTHRAGTPWHQMFVSMGNQILPYTVIPNDLIREHYVQLAERQRATA